MENRHINLIGDSIIDNINYVPAPGKSVLGHLDDIIPEFDFTQLATDGFTSADVIKQLSGTKLLSGVSVLSVGGNDLLSRLDLLTDKGSRPAINVLEEIGQLADQFADQYVRILKMIRQPLMVCTIYNPAFYKDGTTAHLQDAAITAVCLFNDHIQRIAHAFGRPVLELRHIFTEEDDYANPIEPSNKGGEKLAHEIAAWGLNDGVAHND